VSSVATTGPGADDATGVPAAPDIRIISGNPDAAEIAAVTAVLTGVLEELADERGRELAVGTTAWQRSQRSLREQLTPGHGAWRSFSG
jgi:hypothetical protein